MKLLTNILLVAVLAICKSQIQAEDSSAWSTFFGGARKTIMNYVLGVGESNTETITATAKATMTVPSAVSAAVTTDTVAETAPAKATATSAVTIDFDSQKTTTNTLNNGTGTLSPDQVTALLTRGKEYLSNGDFGKSLDAFVEIVESDSNHLEANQLLGAVLLTLNQTEVAEGVLYTAVRLSNWTDATSISNLAECLRIQGEIVLAESIALRGIRSANLVGDIPLLRFVIGSIYFDARNYTAAADWFLSAALEQPNNLEAWIRASTLNYPSEGRDLMFAKNVLLRAYEMLPGNSLIMYNLGLAMHLDNRVKEAIPLYEAALTRDGTIAGAKASLATAYHAVGRQRDALVLYDAAVKEEPQNHLVMCNFAVLLCSIGADLDGVQFVKRAFDLNPTSPDVIKPAKACKI